MCNQIDPQDSDRQLQRIHVLERRQPLTSLDDYLNNIHTHVVSGMPSAIHVHPTMAPRPHGKRSTPSSKAPSTKDSRHIYTEANSAANYLLPTPSRFPMVHPVVYSAAAADLWKCRSHSQNHQVTNRRRVYSPGGLKRKTMQPRTLAKFELLS